MIYECSLLQDTMSEAELAGDAKKVKAVDDRMGFITPILKGFLTEMGVEAANLGIQVYGGHGYIKSNKVRATRRVRGWRLRCSELPERTRICKPTPPAPPSLLSFSLFPPSGGETTRGDDTRT